MRRSDARGSPPKGGTTRRSDARRSACLPFAWRSLSTSASASAARRSTSANHSSERTTAVVTVSCSGGVRLACDTSSICSTSARSSRWPSRSSRRSARISSMASDDGRSGGRSLLRACGLRRWRSAPLRGGARRVEL